MITNNIYYVLINSDNLAHYLSKSCICPVQYINNRNDDVQSIVTKNILLSKKNWSEITDCSIVSNDCTMMKTSGRATRSS